MDRIQALENGIRFGRSMKGLMIGGIALTLYDYMLMFDDEIQYVWKGRKTFIFYLYVLNRIVLTACRFWDIYKMVAPRVSEFWPNLFAQFGCIAGYRGLTVLISFMLSSSDVFITLRIYAMTFRNKFIAAYFGTLALLRLILALTSAFLRPMTLLDVPPLPIDTSNLCPLNLHLQFGLAPHAIVTMFELSAFVIVAWCAYRNVNTLKFSAVVRTIVAEATIYFLAMVALQIYIQLSFALADSTEKFSLAMYAIVNPILTMRFALSLKRSADSGAQQEWRSTQVTSSGLGGGVLSAVHVSSAREGIEMGPVGPQKGRLQTP